uniref:Uncharacterized protein n=1 Tax=Arundo donax TaxID=35708 RepID=A0A0A8Z8R4_ARUDO
MRPWYGLVGNQYHLHIFDLPSPCPSIVQQPIA